MSELTVRNLMIQLESLTDPYPLGIGLGFPEHEMEIVQRNNPLDVNEQKYALFNKIFKNYRAMGITWDKIARCLDRFTDNKDLALQLRKQKYCKIEEETDTESERTENVNPGSEVGSLAGSEDSGTVNSQSDYQNTQPINTPPSKKPTHSTKSGNTSDTGTNRNSPPVRSDCQQSAIDSIHCKKGGVLSTLEWSRMHVARFFEKACYTCICDHSSVLTALHFYSVRLYIPRDVSKE